MRKPEKIEYCPTMTDQERAVARGQNIMKDKYEKYHEAIVKEKVDEIKEITKLYQALCLTNQDLDIKNGELQAKLDDYKEGVEGLKMCVVELRDKKDLLETKLSVLPSGESLDIALDAIGDAIENRKIAKQPRDMGLNIAWLTFKGIKGE